MKQAPPFYQANVDVSNLQSLCSLTSAIYTIYYILHSFIPVYLFIDIKLLYQFLNKTKINKKQISNSFQNYLHVCFRPVEGLLNCYLIRLFFSGFTSLLSLCLFCLYLVFCYPYFFCYPYLVLFVILTLCCYLVLLFVVCTLCFYPYMY